MLPDELREYLLGIVPFEEFSYLDRLGRLIQRRAGGSHFEASHHAADDREQRDRTGPDVRPELLLQNLQKIALRQIHSEDWVKFLVPRIGLSADWHRQGNEVFGRGIR